MNLFLAGFSHLKPMCALAWLPPVLAGSRVCSVCSTGPGRQPEVRSGGGGVVGHTVAVFGNFCPKSVSRQIPILGTS